MFHFGHTASGVHVNRRAEAELAPERVRISSFSATPDFVPPRGRVVVCYGVRNAKTVRIDPPVEDVWPSLSRCFEVFPTRTAQYILTAEDSGRHSAIAKLLIRVHSPVRSRTRPRHPRRSRSRQVFKNRRGRGIAPAACVCYDVHPPWSRQQTLTSDSTCSRILRTRHAHSAAHTCIAPFG